MVMTAEEKHAKVEFLGEILIERKVITRAQLKHALDIQKKEGGLIGEILIKLGYAEDRDIVAALVVQCNLPYIAIDQYEIERNVLQLLPRETVCRCRVIPLDRVGDILSVVMLDPLDTSVRAELRRLTNCKIAPFIATRTQIEKAIERWYGEET